MKTKQQSARRRNCAFAVSAAVCRPSALWGNSLCTWKPVIGFDGVLSSSRVQMTLVTQEASETTGEDTPMKTIVVDENIAEFCSINPKTGKPQALNLREKEALFLDSLQSYFRGEKALEDAEFDVLKEELIWQGSDVVSLSRDEMKFLEAARAFERGEKGMPDEEFDALKVKLQKQGSIVAIQRGPRCSIERKITFSDVIPDKRRTFVLYIPAGIVMALAWLSISFEFTPLHAVDPVISLLLGSPLIFLLARVLTGIVVPDPTIMVGDCPSCGKRTHVLFGKVLNVDGFSDTADIKCDKCKAQLKVEKETNRMILLSTGK